MVSTIYIGSLVMRHKRYGV